MIDASELRIGNWIRKKDGSGNFQVDGNIIAMLSHTPESEFEEEYIPLTEEWLLKFGFIQHFKPYGSYTHEGAPIKANKFKGYFRVGVGRSTEGIVYPPIKFVHQLQNLYFALTGKELLPSSNEDNDSNGRNI